MLCGDSVLSHVMTCSSIDDGALYTWGRGDDGRLGHGDAFSCHHPALVKQLAGVHVVAAAGGYYHTAALAADGSVYTWGWGEHGQLGNGDFKDVMVPTKLESLKEVRKVACGGFHTLAVTRKLCTALHAPVLSTIVITVPLFHESCLTHTRRWHTLWMGQLSARAARPYCSTERVRACQNRRWLCRGRHRSRLVAFAGVPGAVRRHTGHLPAPDTKTTVGHCHSKISTNYRPGETLGFWALVVACWTDVGYAGNTGSRACDDRRQRRQKKCATPIFCFLPSLTSALFSRSDNTAY